MTLQSDMPISIKPHPHLVFLCLLLPQGFLPKQVKDPSESWSTPNFLYFDGLLFPGIFRPILLPIFVDELTISLG